MPKIVELKGCSGCHACYSACPQKCIRMTMDDEGFFCPVVNTEKCVNCGICEKVCPVLSNKEKEKTMSLAYACYNRNEDVRLKSSSGGIFTLLAERIIDMGGVVFGAAFDDGFDVVHKCIDNKKDLEKLRGSKYVQSTIGETYIEAKKLLDSGRIVLFSGTPCQIDGLLSFIGKDYENLYTQDLICHGVPSPKVWRKYVEYMEKNENSKFKNVYFRNKKIGWKNFCMKIAYENNAVYTRKHGEDLFVKSFLKNITLRKSCYECKSKSLNRASDITLADFWGIELILPEMDDDRGTSLVFANSPKGQKLFNDIFESIICKEVDLEKSVSFNTAAYKSVPYNKKRHKFFANLCKKDFETNVAICTKMNLCVKIVRKIKGILKNI